MQLSPESPASTSDAGMDYYSQEAKKKRRKRRLNVSNADRNAHNSSGVVDNNNNEELTAYYHTTNEDSYRQSTHSNTILNSGHGSQFSNRHGNVIFIDESNAQSTAAMEYQQPHHHEDAVKLPLLQKLAVMLKQQQGQGHQ
jgi:hypothetical protein